MPVFYSRLLLVSGLGLSLILGGCNRKEFYASAAGGGEAAGGAAIKSGPERKAAPEFELKDADGRTVRLSDYKGKVLLVNFWATWCGPCKLEIPWFIEFERKYKDRGFAVIGIAMDEEGWTVVKPFVADLAINYRILQGSDETATLYGGVDALPTTFLIDRDGKVAKAHVGLATRGELEDGIKILVARPAAGLAGRFVPAMLFGAK